MKVSARWERVNLPPSFPKIAPNEKSILERHYQARMSQGILHSNVSVPPPLPKEIGFLLALLLP